MGKETPTTRGKILDAQTETNIIVIRESYAWRDIARAAQESTISAVQISRVLFSVSACQDQPTSVGTIARGYRRLPVAPSATGYEAMIAAAVSSVRARTVSFVLTGCAEDAQVPEAVSVSSDRG